MYVSSNGSAHAKLGAVVTACSTAVLPGRETGLLRRERVARPSSRGVHAPGENCSDCAGHQICSGKCRARGLKAGKGLLLITVLVVYSCSNILTTLPDAVRTCLRTGLPPPRFLADENARMNLARYAALTVDFAADAMVVDIPIARGPCVSSCCSKPERLLRRTSGKWKRL